MSLIAIGCTVLLSFVLSVFVADIGAASARRVRAQVAADAVALATVAEVTPYGSARHEHTARLYASLNDAQLIECRCEPGATAVQVTVEVDGATAHAQAVIDPEAIGPAPALLSREGLHPDLAAAIDRLLTASGGAVRFVSGFRSPGHQAELWANALARYGTAERADDWVAPPGTSMHERGLAVDLGGDLDMAVRLIAELDLPLYRPLANEPWHFELVGSRS
jgi:D-alanyl-D-alanine carboxypeptidase/Putative Flp pilus-assembly TadE/G-like